MANNATSKHPAPVRLVAEISRLKLCCEQLESRIRTQAKVTPAQCAVLQAIPGEAPISTGEVCRVVGLSPSRGSRVVDELVAAGWVVRVSPPGDRRVVTLRLTAPGIALQQRLGALTAECEQKLLERLSPEEQTQVRQTLALLIRTMETP